jgi:hypothetical protein
MGLDFQVPVPPNLSVILGKLEDYNGYYGSFYMALK